MLKGLKPFTSLLGVTTFNEPRITNFTPKYLEHTLNNMYYCSATIILTESGKPYEHS